MVPNRQERHEFKIQFGGNNEMFFQDAYQVSYQLFKGFVTLNEIAPQGN